ncbi:MAG: hypothetical protein M1387_09800 [Thaumarchaeota archaeon]|nr:hypothetical protein [Nitrososphaerota archaeon]
MFGDDPEREKIPGDHLLDCIDDFQMRFRAKKMVSLISEYIKGQTSSEEFCSQFLFEAESLRNWLKTSTS